MEEDLAKLFTVGSNGLLDLSPREKGWLARRTSKDDKINFELLARFLSTPEGRKVVELNLQGCGISDQGLQILAPAIARHKTMKKLNLRSNEYKIHALFTFISLLMEVNTTLLDLQIDDVKEKSQLLLTPATSLASKDDAVIRPLINPLVNAFNSFNTTMSHCFEQKLPSLHLAFKQTIEKTKRASKLGQLVSSEQRKPQTVERALPVQMFREIIETQLTHLIALTVEGWSQELPVEIFRLSSLQALTVIDVPMEDIAMQVVRLTNMQSLTLSQCQVPHVDAMLLTPMATLTELNLPDNYLKTVPQQIELLTALQQLDLRGNCITRVPSSLDKLVKLKRLYLHNNEITHLPLSIANLRNLDDFTGSVQRDDPPHGIDISIVTGERAALKNKQPFLLLFAWLKRLSEGSMIVNRCKLMLVGDGNVGKTSTVRSIGKYARGEGAIVKKVTSAKLKLKQSLKSITPILLDRHNSEPPMEELSNVATDGIDIHNLVIKTDEVQNSNFNIQGCQGITFSCWDFAGQEVYYNTHQFFLTGRSIYCVCFRLDQPHELYRVDYWMQSISTRSPGAPVVILGTRTDFAGATDEALAALRKKLKSQYKKNSLIEVFFASNQTMRGISEFVDGLVKICVQKKWKAYLGIEDVRPVSYLAIEEAAKEAAKERLHPIMSWDEWLRFVRTKGNIKEERDVTAATQFLHDTGSIVWFGEGDFRDTVVLEPRWLPDVFASLISIKTTHVNRGILAHADLPLVWKKYPSNMHSFMLELLQRFEVITPLPITWTPPAISLKSPKPSPASASSPSSSSSPTPSQPDSARSSVEDQTCRRRSSFESSSLTVGYSLVPSLLPADPPSAAELEEFWPSSLDSAQISRIYTFDFLPVGFFPRLVSRVLSSRWALQLVWKHGVVAQGEMAQMQLRHNDPENQIMMSLRGPRNSSQLATVIESLNTLISDWLKDATISISVPIHLPSGRTHVMDMTLLEKFVTKGGLFITCMNEKVRLDGIVPELVFAGVFDERSINEVDLEVQAEIGRGGFATVYAGMYKGTRVAVKQLELESGKSSKTFSSLFAEFRREVYLMSRLQHDNIVQLLGVRLHPQLCMVMELMELGPLHRYLYKNGPRPVSWEEKLSLAMDIAQGMQFIHSTNPPLIHRDLKSPNILLTQLPNKPFPTAKIADFGLSRGLEFSTEYADSVVDNPTWLAPEVIKKQSYNQSVDVYAYGVILYEIAMQKAFFGETTFFYELEQKVCRGERPEIYPDVPPYIKDLIQACWTDEPANRPTFAQVVACLESKSSALLASLAGSPDKLLKSWFREGLSPRTLQKAPSNELNQPSSPSSPRPNSANASPAPSAAADTSGSIVQVPRAGSESSPRVYTRPHASAVTARSLPMYIPIAKAAAARDSNSSGSGAASSSPTSPKSPTSWQPGTPPK